MVSVKRDRVGDYWLHFACEVVVEPTIAATGETAGMDFGLITLLYLSLIARSTRQSVTVTP